jgi:NADH-quinone oxidoreductase subunit J
MMDAILFWILAAAAVGASVLVVGQRHPMYSVLLLIVSFGALSGLYVLLGAPFVAAIQIIIYAGAIMVLFLFVVMLLNVPIEAPAPGQSRFLGSGPRRFGAVLSLALVVELAWALREMQRGGPMPAGSASAPTTVHDIGIRLFHDYAFAFEATSVLILIAMVGAMVLARKEGPLERAELEHEVKAEAEQFRRDRHAEPHRAAK